MSDAKHTPGAWVLLFPDEQPTIGAEAEIEKDESLIKATFAARDEDGSGYFSNEVARANARLVAAAPELLLQLRGMLAIAGKAANMLHNMQCHFADRKGERARELVDELVAMGADARAAIAKAEGRTP